MDAFSIIAAAIAAINAAVRIRDQVMDNESSMGFIFGN
jgi:hypothetical protein